MKRSFLKQLNLEPGCDNEVSLLKTSITFQKPNFPKSAGRRGEISYFCLSSKMNSIREGVGEQNYYLVLFHHHFICAYLILTHTLHIHYKLHRIQMCWQRSMVLVMVYRKYRIFLVVGTSLENRTTWYLFCIWSLSRLVQDYQGLRIYQDRQGLSRIDKIYIGQTRLVQDR